VRPGNICCSRAWTTWLSALAAVAMQAGMKRRVREKLRRFLTQRGEPLHGGRAGNRKPRYAEELDREEERKQKRVQLH
jgi:hypothetical protein